MLVLSRKLGERIVIGDNIIIEILEIHASKVKIAIGAPQEVTIYREESYKLIRGGLPYEPSTNNQPPAPGTPPVSR